MNLYLIYKVDTDDYSVSWTGNYSGCSCKIYGIFDSAEKATEVLENYWIEFIKDESSSETFEEWYRYCDYVIERMRLNFFDENTILTYGNFPDDDY